MIQFGLGTEDKVIESWRPNPRQADFLELPDTIHEALYGGALGGGKSEMLVMLPIARKFYQHPMFRGILFRRTFPQLEKSLIDRAQQRLRPFIDAGLCKYNATDHVMEFSSTVTGKFDGAKLYFSYMEHDKDAIAHKTNQYHYIGIDEASEFSVFQLTFIATRLRTSQKDLPTLYRLGSNPGGPSHGYLRDRYVRPAPGGYTILRDKVSGQKRIFIPARLQDNPDLNESDPEYINRLQILKVEDPALYEANVEGNWFVFQGQVFQEFRKLRRPGEVSNALHVIDPFTIPNWWPKVMAIDWGYDAKTIALLAAISPDDRLFIYREYAARKALVSTWGSEIAQMVQYEQNLKRTYLDPSAWQNRGTERTVEEEFRKFSKLTPLKADNDRIGGKLLVHEYLRFDKKPPRYVPEEGYSQDVADWILRNRGVDTLNSYRKLFLPEPPETNLPKLQIFSSCTNLIEAIELCQYEDKNKDGKSSEDVREFAGDDAYDCLRYLIKGVGNYYEEARDENEKRRKMGVVEEDLRRNLDYNAYANRMNAINTQHGKRNDPVARRRPYSGFH